jgi:hypothetical protein
MDDLEDLEAAFEFWRKVNGFHFDPFAPQLLEASQDRALSSYLVNHEIFEAVWGNWASMLYAPAGGGKTAMRVRVFQACWVGQEPSRSFSIPYSIPFLHWDNLPVRLEEHQAAIAELGGLYLLLSLAYRPHWFIRLNPTERSRIRQALNASLSESLENYLEPCRESGSLEWLNEKVAPAFLPPDPPGSSQLIHFCDALLNTPARQPDQSAWELIVNVLFEVLRVPAIYLLLDGLDAAYPTSHDWQAAVDCIADLLTVLPDWSARRIYLKSFLPIETHPVVMERFPFIDAAARQVEMTWSPEKLVEVIRLRVQATSRGLYENLKQLVTLDVVEPEAALVRETPLLPREVLVITRQLFLEHVRSDPFAGSKIGPADLANAINAYRKERPPLYRAAAKF